MNLIDPGDNVKSVTFDALSDKEYVVTMKQIYKNNLHPFSPVGPIKYKNSSKITKDIIDYIIDLRKGARLLFQELKNNRDRINNLVTMEHWVKLPVNEKRLLQLNCTELIKAGLILKVKVKHLEDYDKTKAYTYLINPYVIKPKDCDDARILWKLLGGSVN